MQLYYINDATTLYEREGPKAESKSTSGVTRGKLRTRGQLESSEVCVHVCVCVSVCVCVCVHVFPIPERQTDHEEMRFEEGQDTSLTLSGSEDGQKTVNKKCAVCVA